MGMVRLDWGWTFPVLMILWFFIPSHDPDLIGEMLVGCTVWGLFVDPTSAGFLRWHRAVMEGLSPIDRPS